MKIWNRNLFIYFFSFFFCLGYCFCCYFSHSNCVYLQLLLLLLLLFYVCFYLAKNKVVIYLFGFIIINALACYQLCNLRFLVTREINLNRCQKGSLFRLLIPPPPSLLPLVLFIISTNLMKRFGLLLSRRCN